MIAFALSRRRRAPVAARLIGLVASAGLGGCLTLPVVGVAARLAPRLRRQDLRDLH